MEGFLSVHEAARECHRNPETIRRWIWEGKLPARKLGRQLFILPADLEAIKPLDESSRKEARLRWLEGVRELHAAVRHAGPFDTLADLYESRELHP